MLMNNVYAVCDSLPWVIVVGGGFGVVPFGERERACDHIHYQHV